MLRPGTFGLTVVLAVLTGIGPLTTDMYLPSLPSIANELRAPVAQVGLTISAYLIGFAFGQLIYGPVSDRHGRKPVLLGALLVYFAASLVCALSTSIEMLIAARFVQALGGAGGIVLTRAIVRDLYSGPRAARELSLIGSVMALAPVLAPLLGGVLQTAFGWRSIFILLTVAGILLVLIIWRLLPETLSARAEHPVSLSAMLTSYRIVARNRSYLAYLALGAASFAGLFAWISGASFVLQNLYGLTPLVFGVYFAIGSFGYLTGTSTAAKLVTRTGLDATLGIGSVVMALGGLAVTAELALGIDSALGIVIAVAVFLAGFGMVLPQSIAGAMQPFPERAGAASSLFGFVQQSAAAVSGAVVGWLLGSSAWPLAGALAAFGCLTSLLWFSTRHVRNTLSKRS
jgi:MFS transporter, DHA1 family, multidrug resistance protein